MKWKTKVVEPIPNIGDKRKRAIFALCSHKCIDGYTRWLEVIEIEETYIDETVGPMEMTYQIQYWKETAAKGLNSFWT
jgi:hypothetical protein